MAGNLAQQTDPFAAIGGGVQLPNGQWVPRNHPLAQQFLTSQGGAGTPPPVAVAAPNPNDPFAAIGGGRQRADGGWVPNNMPDQPTLGGGGFRAPGPVLDGNPVAPPPDPYLDAALPRNDVPSYERPEAAPGFADLAQQQPQRSDYAAPSQGDRYRQRGATGIAGPRGDLGRSNPSNWADGQVPDYWKSKQGEPLTLGGLQTSDLTADGQVDQPLTLGVMGDAAKQAKRKRVSRGVGGGGWPNSGGDAMKAWG